MIDVQWLMVLQVESNQLILIPALIQSQSFQKYTEEIFIHKKEYNSYNQLSLKFQNHIVNERMILSLILHINNCFGEIF